MEYQDRPAFWMITSRICVIDHRRCAPCPEAIHHYTFRSTARYGSYIYALYIICTRRRALCVTKVINSCPLSLCALCYVPVTVWTEGETSRPILPLTSESARARESIVYIYMLKLLEHSRQRDENVNYRRWKGRICSLGVYK